MTTDCRKSAGSDVTDFGCLEACDWLFSHMMARWTRILRCIRHTEPGLTRKTTPLNWWKPGNDAGGGSLMGNSMHGRMDIG